MALIRAVRQAPSRPTREKLRKLLQQYGIRRSVCARLMRVALWQVNFYLLPETSKKHAKIPLARWELLLMKVQAIYHPDEEIEITL